MTLLDTLTEYTGQTFKRLKHADEDIAGKEFYDCTFVECALSSAVLRKCRFVNCTFRACDLSLVKVTGSSFRETVFENSKVIGVNWTEAAWGPKKGFMNSIHFIDCVLNHSTFIGLSLPKIKISRCVAKDVDFSEADLSHADFTGTDLTDTRFAHTNLTEADFTGAKHYSINAALNTLKKTKFSLPEAMALLYGLDIILTEEPG
jgi:uncharacterized protein YjbI with pentapeptide repeats